MRFDVAVKKLARLNPTRRRSADIFSCRIYANQATEIDEGTCLVGSFRRFFPQCQTAIMLVPHQTFRRSVVEATFTLKVRAIAEHL